jgi:hypothetical protein
LSCKWKINAATARKSLCLGGGAEAARAAHRLKKEQRAARQEILISLPVEIGAHAATFNAT